MADNITLDPGSGGSTVKTDDDGTAHWQYVKMAYGADNTQTRVTATNGLPVDIYSSTIDVMLGTDFTAVLGSSNIVATDGSAALTLGLQALGTDGTNAQILSTNSSGHLNIADGGNAITVDGTVTANLSATDNAVLDSIDTAVNGTLTVGSHAVTNAGTFAVQVDGDALTALQLIDDAIYADDADWTDGTSKHMLIGGLYQSTPQSVTDGDVGPLQIDSNGNLIVSVSGTVTVGSHAVTNAGTFAVQVDGDALTALQLIDDAVFADDAAFTLTSSKVMVSGAIRDDSLSALSAVEGDAVPLRVNSTGALHVTGGGGGTQYNIDDAGGATDTGTVLLAVRDDTLTTLTPVDGDYVALRVSSTGALHVTGGGGGTEYTDDTSTHATGSSVGNLFMAAATPTDGSVDANDIGAVAMSTDRRLHVDAQIVGTDAALDVSAATVTVDNAGTFAVQISDTSFAVADGNALGEGVLIQGDDGTDRKNINVDATTGDVQVDVTNTVTVDLGANNDVTIDNSSIVKAEDATHNSGDAGVMSLAVRNDTLAALAGTDGDYAPVQVNALGAVFTQPSPNTSGGLSIFRSIDLDESEEEVKGTAGQIYSISATNSNASVRYLKVYNATAATVVVGTTTPVMTLAIPPSDSGFFYKWEMGIEMGTAITVAATTGVADNDTGAPGANEVICQVWYK